MLTVLAPATAAAQVMLALIVWRQSRLMGRRELSAALIVGAVYFLYAAFAGALAWLLPVVLLAPLIVNRALRAGFEVTQRPAWVDGFVLCGLIGFGLAGFVFSVNWAGWLCSALIVWLFLELPVIVWRGLPDDLSAARRSVRFIVLVASAGMGALMAVASVAGQGAWAQPVAAIVTLLLCLGAVGFGDQIERRLAPGRSPLDAREEQVLRRLREAMPGLFADPGLTLSRLAQTLEVPEHRLRRVIHLGEGLSHFSGYLNGYRIAAFKARVGEEASILDLALAVGYNSLSAFNRAFKACEGVTPSVYRGALRAARTAKTSETSRPAPDTPSAT